MTEGPLSANCNIFTDMRRRKGQGEWGCVWSVNDHTSTLCSTGTVFSF